MSGLRSVTSCFLKTFIATAIVVFSARTAATQEKVPAGGRAEPAPSPPLVTRRISVKPNTEAPAAGAKPLNLRYVHSRPFLAAFIHPQPLLASPDVQFFPVEVFRMIQSNVLNRN
jgi:hypothetical protein